MLIRNKSLSRASYDFPYRSLIIEALKYPKDEKNRLYKRMLGFLLGSNIIYCQGSEGDVSPQTWQLLNYIYYCLLILDKNISTTELDSPEFNVLNRCRLDFLKCFNENYLLLIKNPQQFFEKCRDIIKKITQDELFTKSIYQSFIRKIQTLCLNELNRFLVPVGKSSDIPLTGTLQKTAVISSVRDIFRRDQYIRTFALRMITGGLKLHPFFKTPPLEDIFGSVRFHRVFIPARDGVILDGLIVANPLKKTNTKIIALIGLSPVEHTAFEYSLVRFYNLFGHDVIFLHHRNFSMRSSRFAKNSDELANDVVDFAKYYASRNQQVVLYGMCGGAPHMLMAADILHCKNISFKLILDRTFAKYTHVLDLKSQLKTLKLIPLRNLPNKSKAARMSFNISIFLISFILILLLVILKELFFRITNTDFHFGRLLRELPENNVLVMQAKSKKIKGRSLPERTDLVIHPKNDLRHVLKDRRHQNRIILKNMAKHCDFLQKIFSSMEDMSIVLGQLKEHFIKCLELIDNEKLTLEKPPENQVTDLHAHKLFELSTRNRLPLPQFLSGFFSKPKESCIRTFSSIAHYSRETISKAVKKILPNLPEPVNEAAIDNLHMFLADLKKHEHFLCYMGDRLTATGLGNFNQSLQNLISSTLFVTIKNFESGFEFKA